MKLRTMWIALFLATSIPLGAQDSDLTIVRDLLAPPSLFENPRKGDPVEPRERLTSEGITFGKDESIAYDPVSMRLFVRAKTGTIYRIQKLIEAEMARSSIQVSLTCRILETREPLFSAAPANRPSLVSTRVLTTDDEVESLVTRAGETSSGTAIASSSLTAKTDETTEVRIGDHLTRSVMSVSADHSTVDLAVTLLQIHAGDKPEVVGETRVAIPSGSSLALEEWRAENSWRTHILTARLVDASGAPVSPRESDDLPGEQRLGLGGSLFPGPVPVPALEKVKTIILPSVEFEETPLLEAIEILKKAGAENDRSLPETGRGVDIRYWYSSRTSLAEKPLTLRLSNVPLIEAIRYTASLAGCAYRVEGGSVLIGAFPPATEMSGAEEIWYAAFLRGREADELEGAGKMDEAKTKRLQALKLYEALRERNPEFASKAVEAQIQRLNETLSEE